MLLERSRAAFERLLNLRISVRLEQLNCFAGRRTNRRDCHLRFYTQTARYENAIEKVKGELHQ